MQLQSITEIFNQRFFRIPDYQRGYSWGGIQLQDFWNDINNIKEDKVHYTGVLTVERVENSKIKNSDKWKDDRWLLSKGFKAFHVIDGQQRLTSIVILLNTILKKFNKDEGINYANKSSWEEKFLFQSYGEYKSYIFGYEKDDPSNEYFKTEILEQESLSADKYPKETLYTSNLEFAKDFFEEKIKDLKKKELENIFKKVVNSLKFNYYEIDDELDVFVTFETMNNRGKQLSTLELLKNRLIYLTTLLEENDNQDKNNLRNDINEVWKTVYEFLGKNKENPLDDDTFLKNHWIMYFKYSRKKSKQYKRFLLNKYFTAQNVLEDNSNYNIGFKEIKNYITSISESIKKWFYIYNPKKSDYHSETKEYLSKLKRLNFGSFEPLIMASMVKNIHEDKLISLLKEAEKFVFVIFRVSNRSPITKNSHFYRRAHNLYDEKYNSWNIDRIIKEIKKFTSDWYDKDKFKNEIKDNYSKGKGFYDWNGLRHFLYEYELYLNSKTDEDLKINWEDIKARRKEDTIEHIYPQTADKKYWVERYDKYNKKEKKILRHSLGNLVLISRSKNSSLKNNSFPVKKYGKKDKFKSYNFGSFSEVEVGRNEDWNAYNIVDRGIKLLEFLEERWEISLGNYEEKKKILLLDFVD